MPELPEVETICRSLNKEISNKEIYQIHEIRNHTIHKEHEIIFPFTITSVYRRAKFIIFETSQDFKILIHLRMTGKLIYPVNEEDVNRYTRAYFKFTDGKLMIFDDVRCFGTIEIIPNQLVDKRLNLYGIEPFSQDFNKTQLKKLSSHKQLAIKQFLLDQKMIVGIGNIYAQEILFRAKISPLRSVSKIKMKEWVIIVQETQKVLEEAISKNGTSISDFRRIDNKTGEFQNFLQVYSKKTCPLCQNELMVIRQGGRSTRYCEKCQK